MTREEAIQELEYAKSMCEYYSPLGNNGDVCMDEETRKQYEAFDFAIKALSEMPCEDAISRDAVLDLCDSTDPNYEVRHFKEDVECLPSVQLKVKTGRWRPNFRFGMYYDEKFYICSECNKQSMEHSSYCPNCGAKMESEG